MVRTIEKWRMGCANLLASVASRARERSYYNSRPVTTAEPSISNLEWGDRPLAKTARGSQLPLGQDLFSDAARRLPMARSPSTGLKT
jgi:hypothetical protein